MTEFIRGPWFPVLVAFAPNIFMWSWYDRSRVAGMLKGLGMGMLQFFFSILTVLFGWSHLPHPPLHPDSGRALLLLLVNLALYAVHIAVRHHLAVRARRKSGSEEVIGSGKVPMHLSPELKEKFMARYRGPFKQEK